MLRQHHESYVARSTAETFAALVQVLARGRWGSSVLAPRPGEPPPIGTRYCQQRRTVLRSGRVVECIRPVALTLQETLHDPPCRVELKLRWRLVPADAGVRLLLDAHFDLRGAATFRRRHWKSRIRAHCTRMLASLEAAVLEDPPQSSVSGQRTGNSSIAVMNVTSVSGTPTFRK